MPFDDVDASVPIWLSARVAGPDGLAAAIESAAAGIGDVRRTGAVVILDGADEVGARRQGGGEIVARATAGTVEPSAPAP
jgi:flavin-dependent dehydrogenase